MNKELLPFPSIEKLSIAAADHVIEIANNAISKHGVFSIALAGGSTPRRLYETLCGDEYKAKTDWSAWQIYFSDERIVPIDDQRSNYNMANTSLLSRVPLSPASVHIPPVQLQDPSQIAREYEHDILQSFPATDDLIPRFDLILLGLGSDGHTASLFPEKPTLQETRHLVVSSSPGTLPPPVDRITFTLPLINAARHCIFLAGGADKASAFDASYNSTSLATLQYTPASMVRPFDEPL